MAEMGVQATNSSEENNYMHSLEQLAMTAAPWAKKTIVVGNNVKGRDVT